MSRTQKYVVNITALVTAIIVALGLLMRSSAPAAALTAVNQHWVLTDSFRAFQEGLVRKQLADSLIQRAEVTDIRRMVAGLDSSDRCRRGQPGFCR